MDIPIFYCIYPGGLDFERVEAIPLQTDARVTDARAWSADLSRHRKHHRLDFQVDASQGTRTPVHPAEILRNSSLTWLLLMNISLPLLLFYHFHASICLADVWHVAYIPLHSKVENPTTEHSHGTSIHESQSMATAMDGVNPELSTGHFSWTRPDPTRRNVDPTRPDPRLPTKSLTRPDPTRGPTLPQYV